MGGGTELDGVEDAHEAVVLEEDVTIEDKFQCLFSFLNGRILYLQ